MKKIALIFTLFLLFKSASAQLIFKPKEVINLIGKDKKEVYQYLASKNYFYKKTNEFGFQEFVFDQDKEDDYKVNVRFVKNQLNAFFFETSENDFDVVKNELEANNFKFFSKMNTDGFVGKERFAYGYIYKNYDKKINVGLEHRAEDDLTMLVNINAVK